MTDDESGHQYDACDYLACISGNYGAFSSLMVMFMAVIMVVLMGMTLMIVAMSMIVIMI